MRKHWFSLVIVAIAVVIGGGWLYETLYPVPPRLVGAWENESAVGPVNPGELQLVISQEGMLYIKLDPALAERRARWHQTQYHLRVRGGIAEVWWQDPDRKKRYQVKLHDRSLTVSLPDPNSGPDGVFVFRKVQ